MTVLVTGGAGFIGSHTCIELLNADYEIVVLDNFSNSSPEVLERVKLLTNKSFKVYKADLLDQEKVNQVFHENNIEAVIHFAGLKAVGESVQIPLHYYQNNLSGTLILCEVMKRHGVKKIVFSSSATVYGDPTEVPIVETSKLSVTNPYGRTKLMVEEILRDMYASDHEWSIALLRYFNPIGAHTSGFIGEDPKGIPNNLMPYITQVAAGKQEYLNIFGNDYPTADGTGVRDFIHVVDLAVGHIRALEKILSTSGVDAYNLGTGAGYSVLEIVKAFEHATGVSIPYKFTARRAGDIAASFASPIKAKKELEWEATKDIYDMCLDAWRWQSNYPNGYN
ncbi:UDP-glucose 4-epimerase GalE [Niallia sp. 01092]|uniref:UDP-glucose 4-epimerase GalE n=1 Tax=unclassified Niallia TaxID=2837522 RepID=UPI003FD3C952